MRIFAKEWVSNLMQRLGMEEGVPIESKLITQRIATAQKAVEAQNFEARKHLLEYDDVMNKQREAVYGLRRQLLEGVDQKELILEDYVSGILSDVMDQFCGVKVHPDNWDIKGLKDAIFTRFGVDILAEGIKPESLNRQELGDAIFDKLKERYDAKEKLIGPDAMRYHERMIMLSVLDSQWKDHLLDMDHLKEGIGLRGYGQHDPLVEYKRESFDMFEAMMQRFQEETARYLYLMQILERPAGRRSEAPTEAQPHAGSDGNGSRPPRNVSTSVDELEESFQRKKRRELEQARMAGSGEAQHGAAGRARRSKSRPQRSLSLRLRQEIQEVLRRPRAKCHPERSAACEAMSCAVEGPLPSSATTHPMRSIVRRSGRTAASTGNVYRGPSTPSCHSQANGRLRSG